MAYEYFNGPKLAIRREVDCSMIIHHGRIYLHECDYLMNNSHDILTIFHDCNNTPVEQRTFERYYLWYESYVGLSIGDNYIEVFKTYPVKKST